MNYCWLLYWSGHSSLVHFLDFYRHSVYTILYVLYGNIVTLNTSIHKFTFSYKLSFLLFSIFRPARKGAAGPRTQGSQLPEIEIWHRNHQIFKLDGIQTEIDRYLQKIFTFCTMFENVSFWALNSKFAESAHMSKIMFTIKLVLHIKNAKFLADSKIVEMSS